MGDPYSSLSDEDLALRIDRGDREALNVLCRRHYSSVFRSAYRLTQNTPEAEDCTQEAFGRFIRSWARWTDRTRGAGPWLATIVRNVAMDSWQRRFAVEKVNAALFAKGTLNTLSGSQADHMAEDREALTALEEALGHIGPACRELIELLFRKGLTQREAAEILGDSHEAVKKRYQRCRKELQADLAAWRRR